ncbi:Pre-mRNA 3'-end-processing endonuclease polyadenylation factor [Tolypocladium capitatum]|uniref:Pre-mRNA 3'-end-processing endonuclease polyadenylation factor n=1 Tax=Tolypocladium capitatum TaxID=45235 RepID=A0A2K3Q3L2_9HYPO|nr:Pre-mRNA 3'-end-processing endonuclease polyadenylation factor [Tolypocladium capitatum]
MTLPEIRNLKSGKEADADADAEGGETKVPEEADEEVGALVVVYLAMGCVTVRYRTHGKIELEWEGNMFNDSIADSIMGVLLNVENSPAAVKRFSAKHSHSHSYGGPETELEERRKKEMERLHKIGLPVPGVTITVDMMVATVWLEDLEIE